MSSGAGAGAGAEAGAVAGSVKKKFSEPEPPQNRTAPKPCQPQSNNSVIRFGSDHQNIQKNGPQ